MATVRQKLTSRKFWLCVAAFLASIATSIAGVQNGNESLATVGLVCSAVSAAIYAAAEAYVDGARLEGDNNDQIHDSNNSSETSD